MELRATLNHLNVTTPNPAANATFYADTYGMAVTRAGDELVCSGPGRAVVFSEGRANHLKYASYRFADMPAWQAFRDRTPGAAQVEVPSMPFAVADAIAFADPEGNVLVFMPPASGASATQTGDDMPQAILQHFALRTTKPDEMLAFYQALGFILSDRVEDDQGNLRACFLRTEQLHHSLALFTAPLAGFDHQSFETGTWNDMRVWGDRMAALRVPIVWGIGRHGPGNDVFFMVRDPDGNLAEISAEIEVCEPDRPVGVWVHEERTLNLWGKAIMRG